MLCLSPDHEILEFVDLVSACVWEMCFYPVLFITSVFIIIRNFIYVLHRLSVTRLDTDADDSEEEFGKHHPKHGSNPDHHASHDLPWAGRSLSDPHALLTKLKTRLILDK